jgi:hypothetical protein
LAIFDHKVLRGHLGKHRKDEGLYPDQLEIVNEIAALVRQMVG